jgi:hypothetical protein
LPLVTVALYVGAMAKAMQPWRVLPHRPIEKLESNLWRVEGDMRLIPLKRVMTVARCPSDGSLVVHNAIALEEDAMNELDAWGEVKTIVVPSRFHRLDAPLFAARYPDARVICPPGATKKVQSVVRVDGTYVDTEEREGISFQVLDGMGGAEGVMEVRSTSGITLVFNDVIFNMPHIGGFSGFMLKHVTKSSGGPRVTNVDKWILIEEAPAFRRHLERLAETDGLSRIIVSHHETVDVDAAHTLAEVARGV